MKGIDKVFVLGAPQSTGSVTSRVVTMSDHYPRATQDSPSSLTALRTRHQDIFKQWSENGGLNDHQETNPKALSQADTKLVGRHQQKVDKIQDLFDTRRQAKQMQRGQERATPPAHLNKSTSELGQGLESFRDVLMEMTSQRQKE